MACTRLTKGRCVAQQLESFGTTTSEFERLRAWLQDRGVTHVAMEATGVYWKPIWHFTAPLIPAPSGDGLIRSVANVGRSPIGVGNPTHERGPRRAACRAAFARISRTGQAAPRRDR